MEDLPELDKIVPDREYAVSGRVLQAIVDELRRLGKITAHGDVAITSDSGGITIGVKRAGSSLPDPTQPYQVLSPRDATLKLSWGPTQFINQPAAPSSGSGSGSGS